MGRRPKLFPQDKTIRPEAVNKALECDGTTPLDVMTNTMRLLYAQSQLALEGVRDAVGPEREYLLEVARKHALDACGLAKEIAPYVHRRQPQAIETKDLTEEERRAMSDTVRDVERILAEHQHQKRATEKKPTAQRPGSVQ